MTLCSDGGIAIEHDTGRTGAPGVYAGGDVAEAGPESIIAACADGRRAAEAICQQFRVPFTQPPAAMPELIGHGHPREQADARAEDRAAEAARACPSSFARAST